jgi:hypothetical protein
VKHTLSFFGVVVCIVISTLTYLNKFCFRQGLKIILTMRIDILFMLILINLSELQSFVRYKCSCLIEWKLKQDLEVGGHYHVTNVSLSTNFLCESHDLEKPNFMWPKKSGEINLVFQKKVSWRREWVERKTN